MTEYALAITPDQFSQCRHFLAGHGVENERLSFPTIAAYRDEAVVGVISTAPRDDRVVAGPMHVNVGEGISPAFALLKLLEAYERVLLVNGVNEYHFTVDISETDWLNVVRESGVAEEEGTDPEGGHVWFKRSLTNVR